MIRDNTPTKEQLHVLLKRAITAGFYGGIFWSLVWLIAYGLNMVKVNPVTFWDHFFWGNFSFHKWYMYLLAILLYSILSIIFAILYFTLFKKWYHWFIGLIYGMVIWVIFLIGVPYLFYHHMLISTYSLETLIGLGCISVSYGIFIGYTIAFDYEVFSSKN